MLNLTPQGQQAVADLAQRYGFSVDAVLVVMSAVAAGNGTMAQFNHPEFGGGGQWMQGGMTMVGDMFNNALKARVDGLCTEAAGLLGQAWLWESPQAGQASATGGTSPFPSASGSTTGWPAELGVPSSSGSQNNTRYAFFPTTHRLAIEIGGQMTVYDTLDHQISGVSQQQGSGYSLSFTSQYGLVRLEDLPVVQR